MTISKLSSYAPKFILSIISSFVFLEIVLRVWSLGRELQLKATAHEPGAFVILTLGESTTAGDIPYSWPEQLQEILQSRHLKRTIHVVNKAVPGTNTTRILGNAEEQIKKNKPNVIVSMMGINDERELHFRHTLFIPNEVNELPRLVHLFRLVRGYMNIIVRRLVDLTFVVDSESLLVKAKDFQAYGDFEEAEIYLKRRVQLVPNDALGYMQLGLLYREMERNNEAEYMLQKALLVAGDKGGVYYELGNYYRDNNNIDLGETMYKKALELDPEYGLTYAGLGLLYYWYRDDSAAAEAAYKKAIEYSPEIVASYSELADIYRARGDYAHAIALYDQALSIEPRNTLASRERALTTQLLSGDTAGATTSRDELHLADLQLVTRNNYERLIQLAGKYRTPLVIMGYPMQSVDDLKKLASGNDWVTVIDNNENFRQALSTRAYNDLFTDYFGGNFGHATWDGNHLIAERVAEVISGF